MSYKIKRNKYLIFKLLERAKAKENDEIVISNEEFNYFKENFDNSLECESIIDGYYWYVGQDHPSENSSIVTDNTSTGWRFTGTSLDDNYKFNTTENNITNEPSRREPWYIALPIDTQYHLYDDVLSIVESDYVTNETVEFNGVIYKIYHLETPARALGGIIIKK